jgi:osmotically-inducible protein OsmY
MIRLLIRVVLVVVIIAVIAAFYFGYRMSGGGSEAPVQRTGPSAPAVDTQKARETGAAIGETVASGAAQAQQALNEGSVTAKIKSKMALDDTVRAAAIDVDTTAGGVVTLSGTVRSEAERSKALQLARDTAGVSSVVDRLVVR